MFLKGLIAAAFKNSELLQLLSLMAVLDFLIESQQGSISFLLQDQVTGK